MPVFYFSDDFRHFFYQIRLAARCMWYTGILLLDVESATLLFIVELGMAMGFTPCSNVAQSVGDAILWLFDQVHGGSRAAAGLEPCLARHHAGASTQARSSGTAGHGMDAATRTTS